MDQKLILLTMVGMMVVTFVPRVLPFLLLVNKSLPGPVIKWLGYVPSAVLAAMLFPSLVTTNHEIWFQVDNVFLWAAIPTTIVSYKTRSLFLTVITGMLLVAVTRFIMGW